MIKNFYNKFFKTKSEDIEEIEDVKFKDGYIVISKENYCIPKGARIDCLHTIIEHLAADAYLVKCLECDYSDTFSASAMDYIPSLKDMNLDKLNEI